MLSFMFAGISGAGGPDMIDSLGIRKMSHGRQIKNLEVQELGKDLLVTGYL